MIIAEQYAQQVISGEIVTSKWVRLACLRHYQDMEEADEKGLYFDSEGGERAINFIHQFCKHSEGQWSGQPFILEPWQQFYVWQLFGWKKENGYRRFTYSFLEVARKNGKTALMAACALVFFIVDQEPAAQNYFGATTASQAGIAFRAFKQMIKKSPELNKYCKVLTRNVSIEDTESFTRPIHSKSETQDGFNPHFCGIDEYHAHKTDALYNVLDSAIGARTQPHIMTITTAGFNTGGPCHIMERNCKEILEGKFQDESTFAMIFQMDDEDDWTDESNWIKANPNLSVTVPIERLRIWLTQAQNQGGTKEVNFKTKHLNMWVSSAVTWVPDDVWMSCDLGLELETIECHGGLDLASVRDFTALALNFEQPDGRVILKMFFWVPEEMIDERADQYNDDRYRRWIEEGYIKVTPGNATDYDQIRKDITGYHVKGGKVEYSDDCLAKKYNIQSIAYDRFNSSQLVINLMADGLRCNGFGQGFVSMNTPIQEFERLIYEGDLDHGGNPVLRWMAGNIVTRVDPAGNVKFDKGKSFDKIDGMVAAAMSIGEMMRTEEDRKVIPTGTRLLLS